MVACLPEQTLEDFESQLNALKERHGDGSGTSYNESVNQLVSTALSGLFLRAREHLLEQLQDPSFQKWVREHREAFLEGGLSNPRNRALVAAPHYPLSAVFAFFVRTAGQDSPLTSTRWSRTKSSPTSSLRVIANSLKALTTGDLARAHVQRHRLGVPQGSVKKLLRQRLAKRVMTLGSVEC